MVLLLGVPEVCIGLRASTGFVRACVHMCLLYHELGLVGN